jgi:hypothetical protein
MAAEVKKEIQLEIAHVLFTDIVGYSKLPINQRRALVERLNDIVRGTDEFQAAEKAGPRRKRQSPHRPIGCCASRSRLRC